MQLSLIFSALTVIFLGIILSSCCASLNTCQQNHYAICKELRRQIIFNQASSDKRIVNNQSAELPRLLRAYNDEGC